MKRLANAFHQLRLSQGDSAYRIAVSSMSPQARRLVYALERHGMDADELVWNFGWDYMGAHERVPGPAALRAGERDLVSAMADAAATLRAWGIPYP